MLRSCPVDRWGKTLPPVVGPTNLAVITCYFNPANSVSLLQNYRRFLTDMNFFNIPVFSAEVAYENQKFATDSFIQLRATSANILWQKEALLNLLTSTLPREYDAVAWIDADILFFDRLWPQKALTALASHPVCQLFDKWYFTDHQGKLVNSGDSVGAKGYRYLNNAGHPGGAWAARRSVFPLDWVHILGGGDSLAVEGWMSMKDTFLQRQMSPAWQAEFDAWSKVAYAKVGGHITTLAGEAVHLYHGTRDNRRYGDRSRWLLQHNYDPSTHVRLAPSGLVEWTEDAPPELVQLVYDYFFSIRKEDEGYV